MSGQASGRSEQDTSLDADALPSPVVRLDQLQGVPWWRKLSVTAGRSGLPTQTTAVRGACARGTLSADGSLSQRC